MDFWHDFTKTVSSAADSTIKGTERLAASAKLKYRIKMLKSRQNDAFLTVGRLRYAEFCGETVTEEEYGGLFDKIADLESKLTEAGEALADLQDRIPCPSCGFRCQKDLNFCPKCGVPLSQRSGGDAT